MVSLTLFKRSLQLSTLLFTFLFVGWLFGSGMALGCGVGIVATVFAGYLN